MVLAPFKVQLAKLMLPYLTYWLNVIQINHVAGIKKCFRSKTGKCQEVLEFSDRIMLRGIKIVGQDRTRWDDVKNNLKSIVG